MWIQIWLENLPHKLKRDVCSSNDVFIFRLSIQFHWSVSSFISILHVLIVMVWNQEIVMPPALFFLQIALAIWNLLWSHTNFRIIYFSYRKCPWTFHRDALFLKIALENMDISTRLVLLIHEYGLHYYLFVSSVSFINDS